MNKQSPEQRIKNFKEVAFGLSEEEVLKEASRCLFCKKAKCSMNCPVEIDIPAFIDALKKKDFKAIYDKLNTVNRQFILLLFGSHVKGTPTKNGLFQIKLYQMKINRKTILIYLSSFNSS